MTVSTATVGYDNGYLVISTGTAAEVLGDLNTLGTYTGVAHREHVLGFTQYDATHFGVLYWRDSQ